MPAREVAPPVVEGDEETTRERSQRRLRQQPGIQGGGDRRRSARPPTRPVSGEVRRCEPGRGRETGAGRSPRSRSRPRSGRAPATSGRPRSWRLARPVTRTRASPYSSATADSASSDDVRQPAAGDPDPHQRAVVGGPGPEYAGAAVRPRPSLRSCARNRDAHRDPCKVSGSCASPADDLAAATARASRSSDSGSSGTERLPRSRQARSSDILLRPSPIPLRVSPGLSPGS